MRLFYRFNKSREATNEKIGKLEKKILELEAHLKEKLGEKEQVPSSEIETPPTIKIEHLHVDKIVIEKVDYANNFGQLGIKELSGKLNIGTSYEGDVSKKADEKLTEKLGNSAKVNLRAKKESD